MPQKKKKKIEMEGIVDTVLWNEEETEVWMADLTFSLWWQLHFGEVWPAF